MKCCLMQHFIWEFTVCQSTCLAVSRIKRVEFGARIIQMDKILYNVSLEKLVSESYKTERAGPKDQEF